MADAMSDYLENELLDHALGTGSWTMPTTVYAALFTANTGLETNSPSAEVSGGSYARQSVAFSAAASGTTSNSADITFPQATASWGTVTSAAIVDHVSNTTWGTDVNVLFYGDLTASKTVNSGDTFKFLAGDIDITLA